MKIYCLIASNGLYDRMGTHSRYNRTRPHASAVGNVTFRVARRHTAA